MTQLYQNNNDGNKVTVSGIDKRITDYWRNKSVKKPIIKKVLPDKDILKNKLYLQKLVDAGYNVKVDGLWGPWQQNILNELRANENKPSFARYIKNVWLDENPTNKGYDHKTNTWHPYIDEVTGNLTIGPGLDMIKEPYYKRFANGATKELLDNAVYERTFAPGEIATNDLLKQYTTRPDTVSARIKEGMIDISHLAGIEGLKAYKKLAKAAAIGDLKNLQEESKIHFTNKKTNKPVEDKRRNKIRIQRYFHY